jgi:hypothetical protein
LCCCCGCWDVNSDTKSSGNSISGREFEFAQSLFEDDHGKLDLSEFIALELLRLGKVEMATLNSIKRESPGSSAASIRTATASSLHRRCWPSKELQWCLSSRIPRRKREVR